MMNCYAGSGNVNDINVHQKIAEVVYRFGSCAAGEGCKKKKFKHAGAFECSYLNIWTSVEKLDKITQIKGDIVIVYFKFTILISN